jgi:hypothetical protein
MCAFAYYWTDSLQNCLRHSLGHINLHGIIDFYVRACVCTLCATHMVRSHIFGRIRSKIGEIIPLHVLHDIYVRTCVCTLCAHYARACTARMCALTHFRTDSLQTWCNILRVTESCIGYLILRARLRVHAMRMRAHTCAHVFVRSFLDVFVLNWWKHSFDIVYITCTCPLACAHYTRTMHALCACVYCTHVRVHTCLGGFFPKFEQRVAWTI